MYHFYRMKDMKKTMNSSWYILSQGISWNIAYVTVCCIYVHPGLRPNEFEIKYSSICMINFCTLQVRLQAENRVRPTGGRA